MTSSMLAYGALSGALRFSSPAGRVRNGRIRWRAANVASAGAAAKLWQPTSAESLDRLPQQPAQFLDRLRLAVVLRQVLIDQLAERQRATAASLRRTRSSARSSASLASRSDAKPPRCTRLEPRPPSR